MNSVLIIDDDKELCTLMKKCVEQENLSAIIAHSGAEGLHLVDKNKHTLSCNFGHNDARYRWFSSSKKIRETSNIPVIMLTAKSDEDDKISGLCLGADDYLTKPFSINELMARVNSLIRRYTMLNPAFIADTDCIIVNGMIIDKTNRIVSINNIPIQLTSKEFDLLSFLASNKGRVFTKTDLYTSMGRRICF